MSAYPFEDGNVYSSDGSLIPARYDETPLAGGSEPPSADPIDGSNEYLYDTTLPSHLSVIEPNGMAPCYPCITYDPGPRPEPCDEPQVVIEARPAEGG